MQVSYEWLNEFVNLDGITPEQIAHKLTMSGLEVEEIEFKKPKFTNIITAKIEKISEHPNSDRLHLVEVNLGNQTKTVVCGAQNIKEGQVIPYASVGSKVFSRKTGELFELTPAVIRGVESQGMLCSCDELGLDGAQEEEGIYILDRIFDNIKLAEPLEKLLNLNEEIIFHIAPTANRGDQMSVLGVARELSALFNRKLNFCALTCEKDFSNKEFKVEIKDDAACKYYSIGVLSGIEIKPSPAFMQRRLEACAMRPINNVVDITNYVLLELGCPLHAFDFDKLNNYLCVRYADEGEKITTLDEVERKLTKESVVIASKESPVCIAGVFGGNNSEVDDNTKNIALEAAYFTPAANRKSARSVGYRSEASARFERGVDIEMVKPALLYAIELLTRYAGAKLETITQTGINKLPDIEITLRQSEIKRIMGIDIEQSKCVEILTNLGFELLGKNDSASKFKVPSYRAQDVYREIDLIEEVARIYGYENVVPEIPPISQGADVTYEQRNLKKINNLLLGCGFDEIVTSSLVGKTLCSEYFANLDEKTALRVKNPQSEEHTTLRQDLIPNLLNVVKTNFDNGQKNFRLYEIGKTFFVEKPADDNDSGVKEERKLSGAIFGSVNNELWNDKKQPDFYTAKGVLESLFNVLNLEKRIVYEALSEQDAKNYEFLHPAQSAVVKLLGKTPKTIGFLGKIHPVLKDTMKFNQDLYVFEINLETVLEALKDSTVKYKKLPVFLPVQRDIAFAINKEITCADVERAIKKSADKNILKNCRIFDVYQGEHIEDGKKSMAFRLTLLDECQTLTDEIIDKEVSKIRDGLKKSFDSVVFR